MTCVDVGVAVVLVALSVGAPAAQSPADVSGVWRLDERVGAGLASVIPVVETITADAFEVTIIRATQPPSTERYPLDDGERTVTRVRGQIRVCRARWEAPQLVIACVQPDRGPGGLAPPILTREVRFLDPDGRLVVESTWRSGTRQTTQRSTYVRQPQ